MQDRQVTPADDTQRRIQLSALYQNTPNNLPSASSDIFHPNIETLYSFRDAHEVTGFLQEYPFLIPLLQEAYIHIKRHFPHSDVALRVMTDPEVMGGKQLIVFILVEQTAKEASPVIDQLDEEWGLDAMERVQDLLCITLEFI